MSSYFNDCLKKETLSELEISGVLLKRGISDIFDLNDTVSKNDMIKFNTEVNDCIGRLESIRKKMNDAFISSKVTLPV